MIHDMFFVQSAQEVSGAYSIDSTCLVAIASPPFDLAVFQFGSKFATCQTAYP